MNRVHTQYLETGKREPELATLLILADALGVLLDELAGGWRCRRSGARRRNAMTAPSAMMRRESRGGNYALHRF